MRFKKYILLSLVLCGFAACSDDNEIEIPVQVNGKLKTTITINLDENESSVKEKVHSTLEGKLDGKSIVKEIYVKNKIYNVVVK